MARREAITATAAKRPAPTSNWTESVRHLVPGGSQMTPRELEQWLLILAR